MSETTADRLAALSNWIDTSPANAGRDREAAAWGRISKVAEECGEVIEAFIGVTGQNPRKGVHGCVDDVVEELLDVAVTALCAVEHFTGNDGSSLDLLDAKVQHVANRAGLDRCDDGAS
jgi:NTP pyrophosphatase (non-canonical NTP hydrolase)